MLGTEKCETIINLINIILENISHFIMSLWLLYNLSIQQQKVIILSIGSQCLRNVLSVQISLFIHLFYPFLNIFLKNIFI